MESSTAQLSDTTNVVDEKKLRTKKQAGN